MSGEGKKGADSHPQSLEDGGVCRKAAFSFAAGEVETAKIPIYIALCPMLCAVCTVLNGQGSAHLTV